MNPGPHCTALCQILSGQKGQLCWNMTSGNRVDINIRIMLILLEFKMICERKQDKFKMICERKQDSVLSLFESLELTVALNVNSFTLADLLDVVI